MITFQQRKRVNKAVIVVCLLLCAGLHAKEAEEPGVEQVKIGNFAVDGCMQPGPLFGFGQNIISQYDSIGFVYPSWLVGKNKSFNEILPFILYGIRDDLSVFLAFPTAARFKADGCHSSGSEDLIVQFEYAPYSHHTETYTNQFTFVAAAWLPTGNECKNPSTGFGSPSFFLGVTAEHYSTDWYYYTAYATLLTTRHDNDTKAGNQFFYQAGVGKNIAYKTEKWILMWLVELYGWYEQKARVNGVTEENSGFNMVFIVPSLYFSTERVILQGGIGPVVSQHLFGNQSRFSFIGSFGVGVRFH